MLATSPAQSPPSPIGASGSGPQEATPKSRPMTATAAPTASPARTGETKSRAFPACLPVGYPSPNGCAGVSTSTFTGSASLRKVSASSGVPTTNP